MKITEPTIIEDLGMHYPTPTSSKRCRYGLFRCACGNTFKAQVASVKSGNTTSCGCYKKQLVTTHGLRYHRLYKTWSSMLQRTNNPNHKYYKDYGARGISVCDRWKDVANFIADMEPGYEEGASIDRIDVNGNYEPSNCRWATNEVQHQNTRVLMITNTSGYRGVTWDAANGKWKAQISVCGTRKHLGCFDDPLEAAQAYDKYVIENSLEHTINNLEGK